MSRLQQLMVKYRFKPDRRMSQNFCISDSLLDRLLDAAKLQPTDKVLEIGAGTGFLTERIQKTCPVLAIEKDDTLFELLHAELPAHNLTIRHEDFLESKFEKGDFNKVVSLPPYSVSSEIIYKLLETGFDDAFLVFQKEFAEKLVSVPGFADYAAVSVLTQYYCDANILFTVESNAFFPKPNGFSAVLHLKPRPKSKRVENEPLFVRLVKELFRYKNKTLENALELAYPFVSKQLGYSKEMLDSKTKKLSFRGQKIYLMEVDEFVKLFNALSK
jgi:16S rRNA (adenine1518-N6/adenine1519-N6)-dimethyltransferase